MSDLARCCKVIAFRPFLFPDMDDPKIAFVFEVALLPVSDIPPCLQPDSQRVCSPLRPERSKTHLPDRPRHFSMSEAALQQRVLELESQMAALMDGETGLVKSLVKIEEQATNDIDTSWLVRAARPAPTVSA